jgi:nitroreductase
MKFDQIVENRRSTRSFESRPIENKDLIAIVEAARLAPSACNSQTWRFIAVTNRDTIQRICREAMRPVIPNRWLEQAPLIVVGCSELGIGTCRV